MCKQNTHKVLTAPSKYKYRNPYYIHVIKNATTNLLLYFHNLFSKVNFPNIIGVITIIKSLKTKSIICCIPS